MPVTEPIQIPIEGDPRDFIADAKKVQEQMDILKHRLDKAGVSQAAYNKAVQNSRAVMEGQITAVQKSAISITDFRSAYQIAMDVVRVGGQVWNETAGFVFKYDESIRKLAEVSGTGAEESSRLLQVMDDLKISAEDVFTATKALTKNGLSPTIETLAKLSDEYNKLNPGQEQAKFLMDNFGKSGLKFAEAMSKGGAALAAMGNEVEKSLIRTDAQIAKTRLAELQFDSWSDKIDAIKANIGTGLIGAIDGSTAAITKNAQAIFKQNEGYEFNLNMANRYSKAQKDAWANAEKLATEQYLLANGIDVTTDSVSGLTDEFENQADVMSKVSDEHKNFLSGIGSIQSAEESYAKTTESLTKERIQIEQDRADAIAQGWWESSEKVKDYDNALAENAQKVKENEEEFKRANNEILLGLAERKFMQDGVLDDKEFQWLLDKGVAWGVYSATAVEEMKKAEREIEVLTNGINEMPSAKDIRINIVTTGGGAIDIQSSPVEAPRGTHRRHAQGGDFLIPMSYGNEGFRLGNGGDTASGGEPLTITPKGKNNDERIIALLERIAAKREFDEGTLSRIFTSALMQAGR